MNYSRRCIQCKRPVISDECTIEAGDGFEVTICDDCHINRCWASDRRFEATTDTRLNDTDIDPHVTLWVVRVGDRVKHEFRGTVAMVTSVSVEKNGRIIIHVVSVDNDETNEMRFSDYADRFEPAPATCRVCGKETRRFHGDVGKATCFDCAEKDRPATSDKPGEQPFTLTVTGEGRKLIRVLVSIHEIDGLTVTMTEGGTP